MTNEVGDWTTPSLTVTPGDATTVAALTVVSPAGVTTAPAATTSDIGVTWTAAPYELTSAGEWVERWTVTGTGKSKERRVLLVAPDPTDVPTGARVYATTADYATWLRSAPPSSSRRALAAASRAVDELLLTAVYDVDTAGLPTDADVIVALRDATCAQAEYAKASGDTNLVGAAMYHSMQIGSVNLTRGYTAAGSSAPGRYSPVAWSILHRAGLTNGEPAAW